MIRDIAIIGGGNAGLSLAIALQKMQYNVTVYEQSSEFLPVGGDIGLWGNGLKVFDKMGVYQAILAQGATPSCIKLATEEDELIATIPIENYYRIDGYDPVNINRSKLLDILVAAVGKKNIVFNKRCVSIEENNNNTNVTAHFTDGDSITADLIMGADGKKSMVRTYVEPNWHLDYAGYLSMGGIVTVPHTLKYHFIYGKHYSGSFAVNKTDHVFFFDMAHEECNINQRYPTLTSQLNLFRSHSVLIDSMVNQLEASIRESHSLHYFFVNNYNLYPLQTWSKGRVVLVGDAAHLVGSLMGCATSIILEGIDLLTELLSQHQEDYGTAFSQYQTLQRPRALELLRLDRRNVNNVLYNRPSNYLSFQSELINFLSKRRKNLQIFGASVDGVSSRGIKD